MSSTETLSGSLFNSDSTSCLTVLMAFLAKIIPCSQSGDYVIADTELLWLRAGAELRSAGQPGAAVPTQAWTGRSPVTTRDYRSTAITAIHCPFCSLR